MSRKDRRHLRCAIELYSSHCALTGGQRDAGGPGSPRADLVLPEDHPPEMACSLANDGQRSGGYECIGRLGLWMPYVQIGGCHQADAGCIVVWVMEIL